MSIDPHAVPIFPNYFLRFDAPQGTIELDGLPIEPAAGETAQSAAINAVETKIRKHNLTAVRVTVQDADGDQHAMVVTSDGETIELDGEDDTDEQSTSNRPLWRNPLLIAGVALLTVATAGLGAAVALNISAQAESEQPPPWEVPGADIEIPSALPEGYDQWATWSLPVSADAGAIVLPDGRLLTGETDGTMTARDPVTAEPSWIGAGGPSDLSDLEPITWGDAPAIAASDNQTLYIWPLHQQGRNPPSTDPVTFDLSNRAAVSFTGYPLISLGDFIVAVPDVDEETPTLDQVTIPVGTDPVAATDTEVVSIDGDQVYRVPVNGGETTEVELDVADDHAGDPPTDVWPLTADVTLAIWEAGDSDEDTHAALFDLSTGDRLASGGIESIPQDSTDLTIDHDQQLAVLGTVVIDYSTPHIGTIPSLDSPAIGDEAIYGQTNDGLAAVPLPTEDDPTRDEDDLSYYDAIGDEDSPPELLTDDAAYITAPRLDETMLYRAEDHQAEESTNTDEPEDQDSDDTED